MLRGTAAGLEFVFGRRDFDAVSEEIVARLAEQPDFYRGSRATAIMVAGSPEGAAFQRFVTRIGEFGVVIGGIYGDDACAGLGERMGLPYLGLPPDQRVAALENHRPAPASRVSRPSEGLTPAARSLDADFAGARADLAARRLRRGRDSGAAPNDATGKTARYHRGTLRSGKAFSHIGHVVIVGDVNPGAEVVAGGDIVVMGSLRGTAHAGAQGDASARVIALEFRPTQLRIAALIAVDGGQRGVREPEEAFVAEGRIAIAPLGKGPR
ncbi:MAG TPA: septum site-determining protein MinC [Candidatus Baltobacteraceae bacterium]|jgi:septum site-determining protein MinC|nr:septum site-determining protein MinC [Candidatus Baltobacteraceae bacterium]